MRCKTLWATFVHFDGNITGMQISTHCLYTHPRERKNKRIIKSSVTRCYVNSQLYNNVSEKTPAYSVYTPIPNVGKYLPVHTASHPRQLESSPIPLSEPHTLVRTQMLRVILEFNNIFKNTNEMRKGRKKRVKFVATGCEIHFSKLSDHILHFIKVRENLYMNTVSYKMNKIHDMRVHNKEVLHRHLQTWLICREYAK